MEELVSVIIPSYGGGEFLRRCVDSVLNQTYHNIEVVVVDDNGLNSVNQKRTAAQMDIYKDNPKVKYVCHEFNKNGSAARNTGVNNSSGEYISLLDDDDEFYPDNIETHVSVISTLDDDYALTYCGLRSFVGEEVDHESHPTRSGSLLFEVMTHRVVIGSSSLLIRRSAWEALNGFDESFLRHQDWEFSARVCDRYKVKAIDHIGVKRNIMLRNSPKNADVALKYRQHYLEKMKPYIAKLTPEQQKLVIRTNLMDICVQYLKANKWRQFARLYCSLKPGIFGIKYLWQRLVFAHKRGKL